MLLPNYVLLCFGHSDFSLSSETCLLDLIFFDGKNRKPTCGVKIGTYTHHLAMIVLVFLNEWVASFGTRFPMSEQKPRACGFLKVSLS